MIHTCLLYLFKWSLVFCMILSSLGVGYGQVDNCDLMVVGKVVDIMTKEPIPFATVKIQEYENGTVTNEDGDFVLESICDDEVHLEVRFLGYKTVVHHHDFHHEDPLILLAPSETLLESIVIEESRVGAFRSLSISQLEVDDISLLTTSIGDLTESISGVSSLKTGANISKPIVHGLHSNRVLVINDGLRHAYQVWGEGHAPEIDPSLVKNIEVVKGAGTVKYGPEALGGVILYKSQRPELDHKLNRSAGTSVQSNGRSYSGQLSLSQGTHSFAWSANAFGVRQADLSAPAYNLSNTGKRELGGSFHTLYHRPQWELEVSGSYLDQELGILRGSIVGNLTDLQNAIDRGVPNPTFEPTYDIQNPRHDTQHGILKSDLSLFLGDHIIQLKYGAQRNIRREFDVRRGALNDRPIIDLTLWSHIAAAEWVQPTRGKWSGNSGVQLFTQHSKNRPGSNPINFVPDYDVFNIGAYTIQSLDLDGSVVELGVRLDHQNLSVRDTIRDVTIYDNEVNFTNATFTLGYKRKINEALSFYANIGTAWRPPNVAELYSFGFHFSRVQFGLWRYDFQPNIITPLTEVFDQSVRQVPSERSLKLVSGLEVRDSRWEAEFIGHINRINDYIFLRPFGVTTNVAGTFPFFIFSQTDALFLGSDWDIRYFHNDHITSELKASYVYALETDNDQPFIEIPPLNVNYSIEYNKGKWGGALTLDYTARQWNAPGVIEPSEFQNGGVEFPQDQIFDFIQPPDAYFLFGGKLSYDHSLFYAELRVDNLFDTTYRSYTDRLRYFADAPGRNVGLTIGVEF